MAFTSRLVVGGFHHGQHVRWKQGDLDYHFLIGGNHAELMEGKGRREDYTLKTVAGLKAYYLDGLIAEDEMLLVGFLKRWGAADPWLHEDRDDIRVIALQDAVDDSFVISDGVSGKQRRPDPGNPLRRVYDIAYRAAMKEIGTR